MATELAGVATEAAKLAEGRLRAGDISEFESRLARTDAVRLEAARLTRLATRDLAMVRFRALLGLEADAPAVTLVEPGTATAEGCVEGLALVQSALAARPKVRATELQIEAAGARAGLENARIFTLTASLDANAKDPRDSRWGRARRRAAALFTESRSPRPRHRRGGAGGAAIRGRPRVRRR